MGLDYVYTFLTTDINGIDLEMRRYEEKLGKAEGGKAIISIYCIRKESNFNMRGNMKKDSKQVSYKRKLFFFT